MAEVMAALWDGACAQEGVTGACNSKYSRYLHSTGQGNQHSVLKDVFTTANAA